jgi:hypothetical protein
MSQTTAIIGISPEELQWIRMLVVLLRHSDLAGTHPSRLAVSFPFGRCNGRSPSSAGARQRSGRSFSPSCLGSPPLCSSFAIRICSCEPISKQGAIR